MKVLIVDDDKEIVELLNIYLQKEGYETEKAYDGEEALEKVKADEAIRLVILDLMMPKKDGMATVQALRQFSSIPVIMLTAKSTDMNKIQGLIAGADDYVTKPFNPLEVMARVKSMLRRVELSQQSEEKEEENSESPIQVGPLTIKKESHEVITSSGENIQLTALEFGILYLLASHPNRVFSADEIFEKVWQQESVVSAKTVMVHVSHLRDKLEKMTDGEKIIKTVWGVGYKVEA